MDDALRCLLEQGEIGEGKLSVEAVAHIAEGNATCRPRHISRSRMSRCRALTNCWPVDRRVCNERDAQCENRADTNISANYICRRSGAASRSKHVKRSGKR